jgi:hypothetical protein
MNGLSTPVTVRWWKKTETHFISRTHERSQSFVQRKIESLLNAPTELTPFGSRKRLVRH